MLGSGLLFQELGAGEGPDTQEYVKAMSNRVVTPHLAQRAHSATDRRTTRCRGPGMSQKIGEQVEETFGGMKMEEGFGAEATRRI